MVQLLLGHTKLESMIRYLGIEVDDAPAIEKPIDIGGEQTLISNVQVGRHSEKYQGCGYNSHGWIGHSRGGMIGLDFWRQLSVVPLQSTTWQIPVETKARSPPLLGIQTDRLPIKMSEPHSGALGPPITP